LIPLLVMCMTASIYDDALLMELKDVRAYYGVMEFDDFVFRNTAYDKLKVQTLKWEVSPIPVRDLALHHPTCRWVSDQCSFDPFDYYYSFNVILRWKTLQCSMSFSDASYRDFVLSTIIPWVHIEDTDLSQLTLRHNFTRSQSLLRARLCEHERIYHRAATALNNRLYIRHDPYVTSTQRRSRNETSRLASSLDEVHMNLISLIKLTETNRAHVDDVHMDEDVDDAHVDYDAVASNPIDVMLNLFQRLGSVNCPKIVTKIVFVWDVLVVTITMLRTFFYLATRIHRFLARFAVYRAMLQWVAESAVIVWSWCGLLWLIAMQSVSFFRQSIAAKCQNFKTRRQRARLVALRDKAAIVTNNKLSQFNSMTRRNLDAHIASFLYDPDTSWWRV